MSDEAGPSRARPLAPPPAPADVGIVAALAIEVQPLIARMREPRRINAGRYHVHEGLFGERVAALIVSGPGRESAVHAAGLLVSGHRPRWLLSVGFAGGLEPSIRRGTVLFPREVIDVVQGRRGASLEIPESTIAAGGDARPTLVTTDQIVRTLDEKAALRELSGADLVDLETASVASFAAERGLRFLSIRCITDEAGDELPPEVLTLVGPTGGYRVGAAVGAICRRPGSLKDMFVLRERAHHSARKLGESVSHLVAGLP